MFPGPFIIASGHQYCSSWPHTSKTKEDAWWTLSSGCRHCCVKSDKCSFKKTLQKSPLDAPMVDKTWTSANSWCPFHLFGAAPHTWDHHCTYLLFSQRTSDISELSCQKSLKELLAWLELSDTVSIRCFFFPYSASIIRHPVAERRSTPTFLWSYSELSLLKTSELLRKSVFVCQPFKPQTGWDSSPIKPVTKTTAGCVCLRQSKCFNAQRQKKLYVGVD